MNELFQAYGNDLNEAKRWCQQYRVSLNTRDLNQAWDLYYHVFRRISRQVLYIFICIMLFLFRTDYYNKIALITFSFLN